MVVALCPVGAAAPLAVRHRGRGVTGWPTPSLCWPGGR